MNNSQINTIKAVFELIKHSNLSIEIIVLWNCEHGFDIRFKKTSKLINHILKMLEDNDIIFFYSHKNKYINIPINSSMLNLGYNNMNLEHYYLSFLDEEQKQYYNNRFYDNDNDNEDLIIV